MFAFMLNTFMIIMRPTRAYVTVIFMMRLGTRLGASRSIKGIPSSEWQRIVYAKLGKGESERVEGIYD